MLATEPPQAVATPEPARVPAELAIGDVARAGGFYKVGPVAFTMPPDAELSVAITLNDRGNLLVLYDPASGSSLKLDPVTGKEQERYVTEGKWGPTFDQVAASVKTVQ